jgi:amino acid transporter
MHRDLAADHSGFAQSAVENVSPGSRVFTDRQAPAKARFSVTHNESDQTVEAQSGQPELKRVMGPKLLLLFIVGDILGTGVYALTGDVAAEVGGAAWLPFLVAFAIATVTAFSYLELVTKYPQAAGAALYTHKAFGIHFFTFLVAFVVMCSGITSASTASRAFASNLVEGFGLVLGSWGIVLVALGFMTLVALVNFRDVGESVKANVVLTLMELSGLLLVMMVGMFARSSAEMPTSPGWSLSRHQTTRGFSWQSRRRPRWPSLRWWASRTR